MDCIRDDFFSRATLSSDDNSGRTWRHLFEHPDAGPHLSSYIDKAAGSALTELLAQFAVLTREVLLFRGLFDGPQDLGLFDRLCNEVVGAFFDRLDSNLHGAMAGDHDDFKILLNGFRSFEQFHAVHDRQPKIGHQNVDVVFIQQVKRLLTVIGFDDHVFSGLQDFRHRGAIFRIVFDEEDLGCFSYRHTGNKIENRSEEHTSELQSPYD